MHVEIVKHTPDPERVVALAARQCYSAGFVMDGCSTPAQDAALLRRVIGSGHLSVLEHAVFTFAIRGVSRSLSHQLVRFRVASFSQQSQRYTSVGDEYVVPDTITNSQYGAAYHYAIKLAYETYEGMVKAGVPKEDARYVLPNACPTNLIRTMNARELLHAFNLRCCCFDEATEVLTARGWKFFKDVDDSDVFYSLNMDTFDCEMVHPVRMFEYDYAGDMVRVKSQFIDQLVTPNHKIPMARSYDNKKWSLCEAADHNGFSTILLKKNCIPIKGDTNSVFVLPGVTTKNANQHTEWESQVSPKEVRTADLLRFLGFYVSDGCTTKSGYHYNIILSKGDRRLLEEYKEILESLSDNKPTIIQDSENCWKLQVHDRRLYEFLAPLGKVKEKHLPDFVWSYDASLLFCLFEGLSDGDMNANSTCFTTISKRLADDVQRLVLHLGWSASIAVIDRRGAASDVTHRGKPHQIVSRNVSYYVTLNRTKNEPIIKRGSRNAFSSERYDGKVSCVELEKNNTLYVRRNGKTSWSGNSRAQWEIRELFNEILRLVKPIAPTIFENAGASCANGPCPEGAMGCGKKQG